MEDLLRRYRRELNQRINLKKNSNKTNEQIILDNFKYFDLTSSDYCNANNFIKVNERIGVKMRNKDELYKIFSYFDNKDSGLINYRIFAREILNIYSNHNNQNNYNNEYKNKTSKDNYYINTEFNEKFGPGINNNNNRQLQKYSSFNNDNHYIPFKNKRSNEDKHNKEYENQKKNYYDNNNNKKTHIKEKPFLDKLISNLLNNDNYLPSKTVLLLYKNFKNNQNKLYKRISLNEFMDLISSSKINIDTNDNRNLFNHYQNSKDGIFYYELFFDDILGIYWDEGRHNYAKNKAREILNKNKDTIKIKFEDFYYLIKNNNIISVEDFFKHKLNISHPDEYYNELVKIFLDIKSLTITNKDKDNYLYQKDIIEFIKFISFGIQSNDDFYKAIDYIFNINTNTNINTNKNSSLENEKKNSGYINSERHLDHNKHNDNNASISNILKIIRKSMTEHGIKTFFNLIKDFNYYSHDNRYIEKYDFSKVLKNSNIIMTSNEIDQIFNKFSDDNKKLYLNYYKFIDILLNEFFTKERLYLVKDIYNKIEKYLYNIGHYEINLEALKHIYNTKNNYQYIINDFYENFLRFYYEYYIKQLNGGKNNGYKNDYNRNFKINFDEFFEYYKMISFTIEKYDIFKNIIFDEWNNALITKKDTFKNNKKENDEYDDYDDYNIKKNYFSLKKPNIMQLKEDLIMSPKNNRITKKEHLYSESKYNKKQKIPIPNRPRHNSRDSNHHHHPKKEEHTHVLKTNKSQKQYKTINNLNNTFNVSSKNQIYNNIYNSNNKSPLEKLTLKLKMRGLRGLMNLHKQFIFTCENLSLISLSKFVTVMKNQKLNLDNSECKQMFILFKKKDSKYLDFPKFIRQFKKPLNDKRLEAVDKAFAKLDGDSDNNIFIETIKRKYNPKGDPLFLKGKKNEEEVSTEFLDCFELNYNLLTAVDNQNVTNVVSFEEFANFYEYVSFLYDDDYEFIKLVNDSWD